MPLLYVCSALMPNVSKLTQPLSCSSSNPVLDRIKFKVTRVIIRSSSPRQKLSHCAVSHSVSAVFISERLSDYVSKGGLLGNLFNRVFHSHSPLVVSLVRDKENVAFAIVVYSLLFDGAELPEKAISTLRNHDEKNLNSRKNILSRL